MRQYHLAAFICVFFSYVFVFAQPNAPNKKDKAGNRTGKWIYYYDNNNNVLSDTANAEWYRIAKFKMDKPVGTVYDYTIKDNTLIYEAEFKSLIPDTLHGKATLYYTNGVKQYTYHYANNEMNGYAQHYYSSGNIKWECNYENNYPNGTWTEYYENGKVKRTGTTVMGKKDGFFTFYRGTGVIEKTTNYKNDLREGVTTHYDSSGIKTSEFPYKEDMLTGVLKYFNAEGEGKKFVMYYQDSVVDIYSMILSLSTFISGGIPADEAFDKAFIFEEYSRLMYGEENGIYGFALGCLSQLYFLQGDFENGLPWTTKAYTLDKKFIGTDDEPKPDGWHLYSIMFSTYGEDSLAMDATHMAIERSKINGIPTATTLVYMNRMASIQIALKRYNEGIAEYENLMQLCESMGDSVAFDCTSYGLEYASTLNSINKSEAALEQLEKINKMSEGTGLEYEVLYETGKAKIYLNRIEEGLFNYKSVYDSFGSQQRDTILHMEVIRDLGNYYAQAGNYAAAEKLFLESFELAKYSADEDSSDYYSRMMDVADFYSRVGRYAQAIPLAEEVTQFRLRELDSLENDFFSFLNSDIMFSNFTSQLIALGHIYESADMYESASTYYNQARDFALTTQGDSSYNYISATAAMAGIAMQQDSFAESEKLYLQALALSEKYLGADNVNYQTWRDDVSELYTRMSRYEEALTIAEDVFNYRKENYDESDPLVLASYTRLAAIYDALNQPEKARDLYVLNLEIQIEKLNTNFSVMNAAEQEAFLSTFRFKFDVFNQFALTHKNLPNIAGDVFNFQMANKAMLLYSSIAARRNFENSKDVSMRETYEEWLHTKQLIAKMNVQSADETDEVMLDSLMAKADIYEKQLNIKSGGNISYVVTNTWQDIQKNLKPTEGVVEYIRIESYDDVQFRGAHYAALVITSAMSMPEMIVLCSEDSLYQLLERKPVESEAVYAARIYGFPEFADEEAFFSGQHLYRLLWQPIEKYFDTDNTIYITMSGVLHTLNPAAIPLSYNQFAGFKYKIINVGSANAIESIKETQTFTTASAVMIGGVDYMSSDEKLFAAVKGKNASGEIDAINVLNDSRNASGTRGGEWKYLPGTYQEVKSIETIIEQNKNQSQLFTGSNASEDVFKQLSGNAPQILHISTHGFFVEQLPGKDITAGDAMYRSGLLLAGGNRSWKGEQLPTSLNDGILTAAEVSYLDLSGCKLAVLSACETGLGTVRSDEGVFGLQRAFKLAGVENIVMSLWKVSDKETALFMEYFYSGLLQSMDLHTAFRNAQQTMSKRYSPYYWAAFVLLQ